MAMPCREGVNRERGSTTDRCAKGRNEIERLFLRLKGFRRVFSRFEKLDAMLIGFISFALIVDGLRSC
jgi:transposase